MPRTKLEQGSQSIIEKSRQALSLVLLRASASMARNSSPTLLLPEPSPSLHVRRRRLRAQCIRSEEHTSELPSLMRISYAVFCLKKKKEERQIQMTHSIHKQAMKPHNRNKTT